jgi:ribose/xylose/arabinose/galactoside ABC-type transport system permease subunit
MSSEVKEEMRASPGWRFSLYIKLSRTSLYWLNRALPIFCGLVVLVYLYFHAPSFYRINNLLNILVQTSSLEVTAIGNGERVAEQLGIPVRRVTFLSFILSALVASLGGLASLLQVGSLKWLFGQGTGIHCRCSRRSRWSEFVRRTRILSTWSGGRCGHL